MVKAHYVIQHNGKKQYFKKIVATKRIGVPNDIPNVKPGSPAERK